MTRRGAENSAQIAVRLAEMRMELRDCAGRPENADIRAKLLEAVTSLERIINELARPRRPD